MVFPGSRGEEPQAPASRGRLAVSVPPTGGLWLGTRFEVSELEPGFVYSQSWGIRGVVKRIGLDAGAEGGAVSWLVAGHGPLWVGHQRQGRWSRIFRVVQHAHDIGEATFLEPGTVVAVWRTDRGRLRLSSHVRSEHWRREGALGRHVEAARLVSNQDSSVLLTWSGTAAGPGVYVAARLGE